LTNTLVATKSSGARHPFSSIARNQLQTMQMTIFLPAFDPALGLHVPISRHAPVMATALPLIPDMTFSSLVSMVCNIRSQVPNCAGRLP
jgi:hypothetical protein